MADRVTRVVLAVVLSTLAGCTGGTGPTIAPGTPGRFVDLDRALLAPADLPGGWRVGEPGAPGGGTGIWHLDRCPAGAPSAGHPVTSRRRAFGGRMGGVTHTVERFDADRARRALAELRRALRNCARFERERHRYAYDVAADGFAGDESILIRVVRAAPPRRIEVRYAAVVRHGDLVATVAGTGVTSGELRRLTLRAAARMRDATIAGRPA